MTIPSEIGSLSLDEVVNKWADDVAELSAQFQKAASLVSKWDRAIVSNEDRIHAVHKDVQTLQVAHKELNNNLDVILTQQSELHNLLEALEKDVESKIGSGKGKTNGTRVGDGGINDGSRNSSGAHGGRQQAEVERENMHRLSVDIMEELDAMALTIRDLVSELNKGRHGSGDSSGDIVGQIISVLNAHLDSLVYLDESSNSLQKRLLEVTRAVDLVARDSDRMYGKRSSVQGRY